jgi:hypothetical protein
LGLVILLVLVLALNQNDEGAQMSHHCCLIAWIPAIWWNIISVLMQQDHMLTTHKAGGI